MTSADFSSGSVTDSILAQMLVDLESDDSLAPLTVQRVADAVGTGALGTADEIVLMMYPQAGGANETS